MTPADLITWRTKRGLTQAALASLLGIARVTVARYETGTRKIPPTMALTLKGLEK